MSFLKLKNVRFKAFRSFLEEQELGPLPNSGLFLIKGKNLDTGGSSGSGKSSFHLPIAYALGYSPYSAKDLQNWDTEEKLQVEIDFETPEASVKLKRGKENSITVNGVTIQGSSKEVDLELKKILKAPLALLEPLIFREQKTPGFFLSMTDGAKKEFLAKLLGLEDIEIEIDKSSDTIGEIEKQLEILEKTLVASVGLNTKPIDLVIKDLSVLEKEIQDLKYELKGTEHLHHAANSCYDNYLLMAKFDKDQFIKDVKAVKDGFQLKVDNIKKDVVELNRLNSLKNECEARAKASKEIDLEKKKELQLEKSKLESKLKDLRLKVNKKSGLDSKVQILENEIKSIEDSKCGYCQQDWIGDKDNLSQKEIELSNLKYEIELLKVIIFHEIPELEQKIISDYSNISGLSMNTIKLEQLLEKLDSKIKIESNNVNNTFSTAKEKLLSEQNQALIDLRTKLDEHLRWWEETNFKIINHPMVLNNPLPGIEAQIASKEELLKLEKENALENFKRFNEDLEKYNLAQERISKLNEEVVSLKSKLNEELDFKEGLKSFLGVIFEEVLNEIATEANDMLKCLPNVATTTIQFDTEKVNTKGIVKQEIRPIIIKNNIKIPLKAGLSGGQTTSVELAVDLALGNVISRRTSIVPGWLVLDESFEGHDVVIKEACLELLKNAAKDRLIFVIDHSTEVKEYFDNLIEIESKNDVSWIKKAE